ncbi:phytoene dehydrogenase [Patiriisocius marinistellae]|uniref:Phytoene dehydrogenase n=1 Tax=Patiriisocius marinistellae TaxID=2494560 RepID=A0A5J4FWL8_9FLAO|nr:NAD(P)/FAD-dependent oxidoreductase [Patiriisocius marinistellae]GEQ86590.1 phytoene dehydrogenase [Patiriisocius marinistellae]
MKDDYKSQQYDTIIIGAGAGGLASAICLAREGQKVLVLEQHDVPGGWCHSFYLNGHRFTPGVHYVGLCGNEGDGNSTSELYEGLGIGGNLTFFQMNPTAYEHCWIGEERFDYPSTHEELIKRLQERFPHEKKGIKKYLNLLKRVGYQLSLIPEVKTFWDKVTIPFRTKDMGKYGLFTLQRVIDWHIKDPLLKDFLNVQYGDHGVEPDRASFVLHAALMNHYFKGGYYPMGGGGAIIKAMTNAIKKHGSKVKTSTAVKKILIEGNKQKRAIGVELEDSTQLFAKNIISNADPGITYNTLIGKENLSKKLYEKLGKAKYSCTSLMLFLTVDMDVRAAGLDSGNIWMLEGGNMSENFRRNQQADILSDETFTGMFISCTTLKDPPSFDGRYHTIEAITYINYDSFKKYENEDLERSEGYLDFKARLTEKMIRTLEKALPTVRNHIVHKDLGTPITNEFYVNSTHGSVYGTEKTLKHIGPFGFKAKSEVKNLYLCGASIAAHGVAGASYSGVQTAGLILGKKQNELLLPNPEQQVKTYNAEDSSEYPQWILKKMEVKKAKLASGVNKFAT